MSTPIKMPNLGAETDEARVSAWLKAAGDTVMEGEVIAELETDKATVELEAPATGRVAELIVKAGTEHIAVGTVLARIEVDSTGAGDAPPTPVPQSSRTATESEDGLETAVADEPDSVRTLAPPAAARGSTPLARRAAAEHGLDLERVSGSGSGGRIVEADVLRLAGNGPESGSAAAGAGAAASHGPLVFDVVDGVTESASYAEGDVEAGFDSVRLSTMRKTIARRLTESKQQVPHFYLRLRVPMDSLMAVRAELNRGLAESGQATKISLNDFVVKAAAVALRDVPEANVQFAGDAMHVFRAVDLSVAVATPGGLVTPVIRDADRKGLVALANEMKALAARAREGKLAPAEYRGGSLTISNLGMYGIETVYPILNPPQACILGVGAALEEPVVRDGEVVVGRIAALTLAADHRAIDGAVGARWLAALRDRLEDPLGMVL